MHLTLAIMERNPFHSCWILFMKLAVAPYLSPDSSGTYSDHPSSGGNAIILDRNQIMKMVTLVPRKVY